MAGSLVASLLVAILAFRFWPIDDGAFDPDGIYDARAQEVVRMEEILPTRQQARKPPPPAPQIPIIVPDDLVLDVQEIELSDNIDLADLGEEPGQDDSAPAPATGTSSRPDSSPRVVRFVQPEYTREAQRRNVRAEVVVEVLVDAGGKVSEARVVERYLLGKDATERESVPEIGYGLEEAAVSAALDCTFRPARVNGQRATSFTALTFTFGI
jgi:protein TonB